MSKNYHFDQLLDLAVDLCLPQMSDSFVIRHSELVICESLSP